MLPQAHICDSQTNPSTSLFKAPFNGLSTGFGLQIVENSVENAQFRSAGRHKLYPPPKRNKCESDVGANLLELPKMELRVHPRLDVNECHPRALALIFA